MTQHDIADRNVERLLGVAYKPEPIDSAFVQEVEEKLLATAHTAAERHAPSPSELAKLTRVRRRLAWTMAAAACLAACSLGWYVSTRPTAQQKTQAQNSQAHDGIRARAPSDQPIVRLPAGLTAKPRPDAAKPQALAVGETMATKHGERRRVALADGSIVYVNENTALSQTAERQVRLDRGEIYVEVAPRPDGDKFTVLTPERQVVALGTHFHVAATAAGSGVLVTQGTVKVSDVADAVPAGQQVAPGKKQASAAPRASHVLDWLKPLVAAADGPLVPTCQHEGGALIALDPNGQELQLTLRKYHIDVHIEDGFARTTIDQTYFNNTWSRLEGTFYFPLPPDASLSRLAMYVLDGKECKLMEGGMAERDHARNAFETIRYERRDPALLEWVDGSTFKMRVFPLEAWQEKRIVLSYTQRLPSLYGVTKYRFPGGHNMQIVRDWSFAAHVADAKHWDVLTPSHPDMKRTDAASALALRTEARLIKPEEDVVLELREREAPPEGGSFATHLQDGQRYFMARFRPKLDTKPERQRRDWIVLFEASANRDPLLARTQIEAFRNLLKNVEYDDTFTVLTCNPRVQLFDQKARPANPANVQAAVAFLEKAHLIGGCDLEQGLRKALEFAKDAKNPHLVHLGAGVPSLGEVKDDVLARLIPSEVRYIGIGVGKKWNRAFMKMTAERTGGYFTQINPDEPVAWRAFDLVATLNTPRLLDVRVVDPNEKVSYLADVAALAQGEEVCAFARGPVDNFAQPAKVLITGKLDGKPFHREVEVRNPNPSAGFLPRTWAKLEIDRLLADGQDKHKAAITELSKSMYVMSPFTSLLVLESEADYKRFNVDRGRKDHWAMYACPERIPQVYEPDPAYQRWWGHVEQPRDGQKPSAEQVLDTILLRLPPQYIYTAGRHYGLPYAATARQVLASGYALPLDVTRLSELRAGVVKGLDLEIESLRADLGRLDDGLTRLSLDRSGSDDFWAMRQLDSRVQGVDRLKRLNLSASLLGGMPMGRSAGFGGRGRRPAEPDRPMLGFIPRFGVGARLLRLEDAAADSPLGEMEFGRGTFDFRQQRESLGLLLNESLAVGQPGKPMSESRSLERLLRPTDGLQDRLSTIVGGFKVGQKQMLAEDFDELLFEDFGTQWLPPWSPVELNLMVSSLDGVTWPARWRERYEEAWMAQLAGQLHARQAPSWLTYSRPQYQVDHRLFGDLTIYAPAFMATWADIQNTVAQEAGQERQPAQGKIDDAARALIAKARQAGWHAVSYPGVGRIPGIRVVANGQGQFSYQRVLSSGLVEQVLCDGQTLWHLYPEIGLGTRRPFSRFHFSELSRWAPWALPRPEDLALGADLLAINDNTVALVAHRLPSEKPDAKSRQLHLVFGPDGSLAETRVVEMPAGKILVRQTLDAQGNVRLLDQADKQLVERKAPREAADAPDLAPKLDDLVILDMPLRIGAYWDRRLDAHAKEKNDAALKADRLGMFAAACFSRDRDALPIFGAHFHAKGDKRLGFYTLLCARETQFHQQPNAFAPGIATYDVLQEHPQSPLARYLVHHQKNPRPQQQGDAKFLEDLPGPQDAFIGRMAAFRNAWTAWRHYQFVNHREVYEREKPKLMAFLRINTSPLIGFLLQSGLNHLNSHERADASKLMSETLKDHVHPLGMGYIFGYDAAQHLYYKGDVKDASRLYRELYQAAVKQGMLPKIDASFRQTLDDARSGGPNFGEFLRGIVHEALQKDRPHFALMVAMQADYVGSQSLGDELLQHIQQRLPAKTDRLVLLASLEYLVHSRLHGRPEAINGRADALRDRLTADADLAGKPTVWRLSAELAEHRGQPVRALADLEKALDLEYRQLPDLINLEAVRQDYRELLSHYMVLAKAARTLEQTPPADLAGRVVKAADRWRALDSDQRELCQTTAAILKLLGAKDLAWEYLTTPVALRPNEAAPWTDLAQILRGDGELALADDAYARAFLSESTNPQILWDRAQNLLQLGRVTEARALWRQIADGTWQERFQTLVPQARWHLEHN